MKIVGIIVSILVVTFGHTQEPDTLWTRTYGGSGDDVGYAILHTDDGGYLVVGSTESYGAGGKDGYIIKTDLDGNTIWTHCYGGSEDEELYAIKPTTDGNYIVVGYTGSFGYGGSDIWLLKIDSLGDTLETREWGSPSNEIGKSIEPTSDGGYIITGSMELWFGVKSAFLGKVWDNTLDPSWIRTYTNLPATSGGAHAIQATDDGYMMVGHWWAPEPPTDSYAWLVKTDSLGDTVWTTRYFPVKDLSYIQQVSDSSYVVLGPSYAHSYGPYSVMLREVDNSNNVFWEMIVGDTLSDDFGREFQQIADGQYVVAGETESVVDTLSDVLLFKINESNVLWLMTVGGASDDGAYSMQQTNDNGYIVAGYTKSYGAGGSDIYLIKTAPDVGIKEQAIVKSLQEEYFITTTIFRGPLKLPEGNNCKVYDIMGRVVESSKIQPGIYFIEVDGVVKQKVVKVR